MSILYLEKLNTKIQLCNTYKNVRGGLETYDKLRREHKKEIDKSSLRE